MTVQVTTEEEYEGHEKEMSLGAFLAYTRSIKRQSLREIEDATGKKVSNAYLSQLEKGHIKKPSPNILYSLAKVYAISYETLMVKAGYIVESVVLSDNEKHGRVATFAEDNLTMKEEEELLKYLSFLRSQYK